MTKARDIASATTPNANAALLATFPHRNLIINGAWQCSQRGDYTSATSLPTSSAYYLDRFKFRRGGVTGTFTHKLDQTLNNNDVVSTVRLDVTSTATGNVHCFQIFEDVDFFKNKTITFSARVKSNSTNARLVFNADGGGGTTSSSTHTGGSNWELLKGTATITSSATGVQLYCGIQASGTGDVAGVTSGDFFEISQIQVELGSTATPFEHRSYGDELARCQRYFQKINGAASRAYTSDGYWGYGITSPVTMRSTPTTSNPTYTGDYSLPGTGPSFKSNSVDHVSMQYNGSAGTYWAYNAEVTRDSEL